MANVAHAHQFGALERVLRFLVGQVMKATKGKADPNLATDLIEHKLS